MNNNFFEPEKYYHKIGPNQNDHFYFKCDLIVNPENVNKDAVGSELYISPGTSCAQFNLSCYRSNFEGWEEISKKEFISKTREYVHRINEDFFDPDFLLHINKKAEKWDKLDKKIGKFYEEDADGNLIEIGEAAAVALGYL